MGHYFDTNPDSRAVSASVTLAVGETNLSLTTQSGVFSWQHIDRGTQVLLDTVHRYPPEIQQGNILDLGCGYGPIASFLAHTFPQCHIWAIDTNARARECAASNAEALHLSNLTVCSPEEVPADISFRGIFSNPPVRIGKSALRELVDHWCSRLETDACAWMVIQRHLGADSLHSWLMEQGWNVQRIASRTGFRVLSISAASVSGNSSE